MDLSDDGSLSDSKSCSSSDTTDSELGKYLALLGPSYGSETHAFGDKDNTTMTPLFSWPVKRILARKQDASSANDAGDIEGTSPSQSLPKRYQFGQYAVLGKEIPCKHRQSRKIDEQPVFLHTNTPWSAFICGSQGSGKSHLLSCLLENCLLSSESLGHTPNPLAGIVFSYDAQSAATICEVASLSSHIPIKVLVSPTNFNSMRDAYMQNAKNETNIHVDPLFLNQKHLNVKRMMRLMGFGEDAGETPLYMDVIVGILKNMAISNTAQGGNFDYQSFLSAVDDHCFDRGQAGPLKQRLGLLDDFIDTGGLADRFDTRRATTSLKMSRRRLVEPEKQTRASDVFKVAPGTLTIVDLSDPLVDTAGACVLFDICLSIFLEDTTSNAKVVAIDEAHRFMTEGTASKNLTQHLVTTIREQRHNGTRVVIATQEPTISPQLLDLCTMSFVYRFTSPQWLLTLEKHLAGAARTDGTTDVPERRGSGAIFAQIVDLQVGECLLFSPTALLDIRDGDVKRLGSQYVKFKTRQRLTADGGESVMAI